MNPNFLHITIMQMLAIALTQHWSASQMFQLGSLWDNAWYLDTGAKLGIDNQGQPFIYGYAWDGRDLMPFAPIIGGATVLLGDKPIYYCANAYLAERYATRCMHQRQQHITMEEYRV